MSRICGNFDNGNTVSHRLVVESARVVIDSLPARVATRSGVPASRRLWYGSCRLSLRPEPPSEIHALALLPYNEAPWLQSRCRASRVQEVTEPDGPGSRLWRYDS